VRDEPSVLTPQLPQTTAPTVEPTKEIATIKIDECIVSNGEVSTTKMKSDSDADNVPVSVSEKEEAQMESEDEEKDSKASPAPTIEGKVPFVSPPVDEEDNDDDNDDNDENNDDNEEGIFDFDLNNVEGMSEYELMRLQRIRRNKAKLTSLGLLGGMTSTASPSSDRLNRKKHAVPQGDFVRRVQPKRNIFKPTSYKNLDDPVISKRTRSPIDSSDTREEDTGSKRMDKAEYSLSGVDDDEEDNKDELESYDDNDNDKLDRRFPQAKAEAAVEALADPSSPSTGHYTDIYGHSQQYYLHQNKYVAFLQALLSDTKRFPGFPKDSDGTVIVDTHSDYAPPCLMRLLVITNVKELTGIMHRNYNAAQYSTRMEKHRASPLNRCCNHSYGSTPGTHSVSLTTPMTYFPPRSHSRMSTETTSAQRLIF